MPYQYVIDAASLLDNCIECNQEVIRATEVSRIYNASAARRLQTSLSTTEAHLMSFLANILEYERRINATNTDIQELCVSCSPKSLSGFVTLLRSVVVIKRKALAKSPRSKNGYHPERNTTDSLLFRLTVALQLCQVRINDAYSAVGGRRAALGQSSHHHRALHWSLAATGSLGLAFWGWRYHGEELIRYSYKPLIKMMAKTGLAAAAASVLHMSWSNLWTSTKIAESATALNEWNEQWKIVQSTLPALGASLSSQRAQQQTEALVRHALKETPKLSLWNSQGEMRFLMLKRAMDVFYASVGTAMEVRGKGGSEPDWQLTLATAAAASFYSLIGASKRAAQVTSSSDTAQDLIQNAWKMVSMPTVKNLSLQASRLLKGAAVAQRIEVCGIPCFVLSADPAPELAAAIASFHRKHERKTIHTLSTIDEQEEHTPGETRSYHKPFAGSTAHHRQRDVILHLTGGGFFAHIIASDLPFLLDWSAASGAVVICPEYALLPEHTFPFALNQVDEVYQTLKNGHAVDLLGFEVNRIVVTGESAGGNLAAALCVKLAMDKQRSGPTTSATYAADDVPSILHTKKPVALPDALMLSCPVLNLSLELSFSRVIGNDDPVLPSGLISAISDAYVPPRLGISKKNPLASPIYASDGILSYFPPTLLIASSTDPLLDDSVAFNRRLRSVGIDSQLRAAHNLPHAYLGLGTAGFPEAVQVQEECQAWLAHQLHSSVTKL